MSTSRRRAPFAIPIAALAAALVATGAIVATGAAAAGPPFPQPVIDQAVYDEANALRDATEHQAETTIDAIEARTGAEVVVYTQLVPGDTSTDEADRQARALMDQWGVGRKGFDDGLVILFDLYQDDPCHGQVQLYAGPGFQATFLTNGERQAIYENDMLPLLRGCDLDGALLAAMAQIDAAATPEHANTLETARQLNAVLGLLVAPLVFLVLVGWSVLAWTRHGRDPVYLDDPSIHIPAPPDGLTPAAGAVVRDGRATRRSLTAASLDLAARGMIAFEADRSGLLGRTTKLSIHTFAATPDDPVEQARLERARARRMDDATSLLLAKLGGLGGGDGVVDSDDLLKLGSEVGEFNKGIEAHVVERGWFTEAPAKATGRWTGRGVLVAILGGVAIFGAANLPSDGLLLVGLALVAAGIVIVVLAQGMPSRTMPGAMIRAMLEAYRRTLEKTMAQARSMGEVVRTSAIPLIESPDDAVVWGVALGLQVEVEQVLQRTVEDARTGVAPYGYIPSWYSGSAVASAGGPGGPSGWAPGLMSSSVIPDFGGMMSALGTIGNSPSSSGGGGFGGGGSGGGGGGAGGGF